MHSWTASNSDLDLTAHLICLTVSMGRFGKQLDQFFPIFALRLLWSNRGLNLDVLGYDLLDCPRDVTVSSLSFQLGQHLDHRRKR